MLYFILQTMSHFVYIMASKKNGTLYIGSTTNLVKRIHEHKEKLVEGFTKKYNIAALVYVEEYISTVDAINRERTLKEWKRDWKIELIEKENKDWKDLYTKII
jgi:putative endonuclease